MADFEETGVKREVFGLKVSIYEAGTFKDEDTGREIAFKGGIKIGHQKVTAHQVAAVVHLVNHDQEFRVKLEERLLEEKKAMQDVKF